MDKGVGIKPGALCLLIDERIDQCGQVVTAVKYVGKKVYDESLDADLTSRYGMWEIDRKITWPNGKKTNYESARYLLPLTDPDAEIETEEEKELVKG